MGFLTPPRHAEINNIIENGTIEQVIELAKEYDLHAPIVESTGQGHINRVNGLKQRLIEAGIDPDTIRNEYMDDLRTRIANGEFGQNV